MLSLFRKKVPADLTSGDERAAALLDAVGSDDIDGVRAVLASDLTVPERERLVAKLTELPGHPELYDAWVTREPDQQLAWLASGAHRIGWAWDARGRGSTSTVREQSWEVFFERLRAAENDLMRAAEMAPGDPVPWSMMLISGRGLQVPKEELRMRYEEAQSRHPGLLEAHLQLLQSLCKKWFGSHEESLDFARSTSSTAPEGSPLHALVAQVHYEIWFDEEKDAYLRADDVRQEIRAAAERSVFAGGWSDDLVTLPASNIFAATFYRAGEKELAVELAQRIGTRRTEMPWAYLPDDEQVYGKLLG